MRLSVIARDSSPRNRDGNVAASMGCGGWAFDHARLELLGLLLLVLPHPLEQTQGGAGLLLVDLGDRETNVDQDPIAGYRPLALLVEQSHVDVPLDAGHVHLR